MKKVVTLLICLLTLYAPLELTRVIVIGALIDKIWDIPVWQFILEMGLFWMMYFMAMVVVYRRISWRL